MLRGGDVEGLRALAQEMAARGHEIDGEVAAIDRELELLPWTGPDRERLLAEWSNRAVQLRLLCSTLQSAANQALQHAQAQEHTSGGSGW